jgi:hypothetical protein
MAAARVLLGERIDCRTGDAAFIAVSVRRSDD